MLGRIVARQCSRRAALTPVMKNSFCVYQAYLNPERHINTGHNPNNAYEDIVMLGDYPVQSQTHDKVISQVYVPAISTIAFSLLNKKYPYFYEVLVEINANLFGQPNVGFAAADSYQNLKNRTWEDLGVNFQESQMEILEELSEQIFVKENKLRWIAEQQIRLSHTTAVLSSVNLNPSKVSFFVDTYNQLLQGLVHRSNLYQSKDILGEKSIKERYLEAQLSPSKGVEALEAPIPENRSLINSLLRLVHNH